MELSGLLSPLCDNKRITTIGLFKGIAGEVQQTIRHQPKGVIMQRCWYKGLITIDGQINSEAELRQLKIDLEEAMEHKHTIMISIVDHSVQRLAELVSAREAKEGKL